MSDAMPYVHALRASHDRLAALLGGLDDTAVRQPSYADDWSIAQVASHLGSQGEIFLRFLDAGLTGGAAPGPDEFGPIWDRWNGMPVPQQVSESVVANERFVSRIEGLGESQRSSFTLSMFGTVNDLAGLAGMRLAEHALHSWDIAVVLDPSATLALDATELLVDTLPGLAARVGKPAGTPRTVSIRTSRPERAFELTTGPDVVLRAQDDAQDRQPELNLPSEALIRLVYGRLDPDHTPAQADPESELAQLRAIFPGV